MKASTTILAVAAMALGAAAQSASPAASSSAATPTSTPAAAPAPAATAPAEVTKLQKCLDEKCKPGDVNCAATECLNIPAPTGKMANDTNTCVAACDNTKPVKEYNECKNKCIVNNFLANSPGAQKNTAGNNNNAGKTTDEKSGNNNTNGTSGASTPYGASSATYSTVVAAVALFATFFVL
ncbi:hypothetical protein SYNPS1DRAFT_26227 [Syncephalis pseudoplumigaleata]|uniref:Extracellular membrane protein CFEM domain-containing protein n=1 Tax=Syncephalis pseudoplumigaleata TaxID=1712513 RepID=A0A4P9Z6B8_9FUNG|nr:hypothetical protein SYNPS1DRAFT_26227 [Syncephalis pseudoplumigaleata]|eukprot:RKP28194.1 hypothetical protein SYNPS1DRAFT_26227 [Syncephalis pseudoplumigaleata]